MTLLPRRSATGMTIWDAVGTLSFCFCDEVLVALDTGLGFGLPRLGARRDPFGFGFELTLACLFLAAFLGEALLLLLQPGRIIAFIRECRGRDRVRESSR